jgi:GTP-binding protein
MKITKAQFLISCETLKHCPEFNLPEIALVGRSNVGKSSFINALASHKNLAHTSNTPGKTRLINFYNLEEKFIIADLPGYGYAKVSKKELEAWSKNLEEYILNRKSLKYVIQFIDARHDVQKNDIQMRNWLEYHKISIITVATKADALSGNELKKSSENISKVLNTEVFELSSKTGLGKDKILRFISEKIFS